MTDQIHVGVPYVTPSSRNGEICKSSASAILRSSSLDHAVIIDLLEAGYSTVEPDNAIELLLVKLHAIVEFTALSVGSVNGCRQRFSVRGHNAMNVLRNPSFLFPYVMECLALNFRGSSGIFHFRRCRNFFPVRPRQ